MILTIISFNYISTYIGSNPPISIDNLAMRLMQEFQLGKILHGNVFSAPYGMRNRRILNQVE